MNQFVIFAFVTLLILACQKSSNDENSTGAKELFVSRHVGNRLSIIEEGDLSPKIRLDSLSKYSYLYAVGPLGGLKGEVTIYNGEVSCSTILNDQPKVDTVLSNKVAIFLAYANVSEWNEVDLKDQIYNQAQIEAIVKREAEAQNKLTENAFVFRLEGVVDSMHYHIIYKSSDTPHNKFEHHKSKRKFILKDQPIKIVGFWADATGEGVYTHPGKRIHLHFINADNSTSGHIDQITLKPEAKLFLPK
ncbi:MAG: acetolactate decarboxylase [Cyclobacteriaceae bacterium]|nr:acetolactate decarboxylase [Cyclobacteriaceae bacterium HetDA_MAG_MS6]